MTAFDLAGAVSAGGSVLLGVFEGDSRVPDPILDAVRGGRLAGVALYRTLNARDPMHVLLLTSALEQAAEDGGQLRPLICTDQEGGQLVGIPGTTPFPGNLALGAADDPALTERVGQAIGTELAAMGITVDWAPVCDLLTDPGNPAVGTRSFGDDPVRVGRHAAAFVRGLRRAGIGSSAKHFPGIGATRLDPHVGLAGLDVDRTTLAARELVPFASAVEAGVDSVMVAHLRLPGLDPDDRSILQSPIVLGEVLRGQLGFDGVIVSDALDMGAVDQGSLGKAAVEAIGAGVDLLLPGPAHIGPPDLVHQLRGELAEAARNDAFGERLAHARRRVDALRLRLSVTRRPSLDVVGSAEHRALAAEVARRSATLIRDREGLLPVRPGAGSHVLVVVPQPADLTPADTSSFVSIELGQALRERWPNATVDELVVPIDPAESDAVAARSRAETADLVVLGTINAFAIDGQRRLAEAVLAADPPTIHLALRMPHDAVVIPQAGTSIATYGIEPPAIEAAADVIAGRRQATGRLPVAIDPASVS